MDNLKPIDVRRYGCGNDHVVVLHGGPGAPGSAASLAQELATEFSVLEPLQRRSGTVGLTVSRHVDDLAAVAPVCSAIVGHSWGAMLGLSFAARYPGRVSCLALIGCGTYNEECRNQLHAKLDERLGERGRRRIRDLQERLQASGDSDYRDAILKELGEVYMALEGYELIEETNTLYEALAPDAAGNQETWQDALRLQREGHEPNIFTRIPCPALMLHGAFDPHPGQETRDLLRRFIPHLEYMEFEKCGHEPWRERHARSLFFNSLRGWLRRAPFQQAN